MGPDPRLTDNWLHRTNWILLTPVNLLKELSDRPIGSLQEYVTVFTPVRLPPETTLHRVEMKSV